MNGQIELNSGGTQCQKIIRHMKDHGTITSREAMFEYGIMRLASRISDLKRDGYEISSKLITAENRYGEKTHISEYSLIQ